MKAAPPRGRLVFLLGLLILVGGAAVFWPRNHRSRQAAASEAAQRMLPQLLALEAREAEAESRYWGPEMLAQRCGRVFDELWDEVNRASNRWDVLAASAFGELFLPPTNFVEDLGHGVVGRTPPFLPLDAGLPPGAGLPHPARQTWCQARQREGWVLTQLEFRHNRFHRDSAGRPWWSEFGFRAHAVRANPEERAAVEGDLVVAWEPGNATDGSPAIRYVDARRVACKTRPGPPAFRPILYDVVEPPERSHFIDPLLLRDLDGDGRSEIVLAARNRVYRWGAGDRFDVSELCEPGPGLIFTAILGQFDGEPGDDLLAVKFEGLVLVSGTKDGRFVGPGRQAWAAPMRIRYGQALTCGDVDGDGDLDLWLGQYRNPYDGGQMPTPYYNALDGNPAYLLLNDGKGHFTDATGRSGLEGKRTRRTYAASFVDLDDDGDLDLVVVSDFAGVELYANDGHGWFTDITRAWIEDSSGFGMAHAVADFNRDGRLDLFVTGMHCPTASRLLGLGLRRPERPDYLFAAPAMIGGNKLWLAGDGGRFREVAREAGVSRTGWSWGCAAADFDNDGWPDLAIANGHETRASVQEYEPEFWLHDLYVADSTENPVVATYFASKIQRLRGSAGRSYGGWEQNRLLMNRGGAGFVEVGHLFGLALGEDCRNLVADDLDGDGRVDLVLTTFEVWPQRRQTLQVFRNELPEVGNWLGVRLDGEDQPGMVVGAKVAVQWPGGGNLARTLITGDSHRCQSGATLHFGLGTAPVVDALAVRWAGGRQSRLVPPELNRVVPVSAPSN